MSETEPSAIVYRPIGILHTPHPRAEGSPIQPSGARGVEGRAVLRPELAPGLIGAQDKARPCLSSIFQPALFFGAPEIDIADDVGGLRLSP